MEFDASLLEEMDNLPANEILWNTLTAESLKAKCVLSNFHFSVCHNPPN